MVKRRQKENSPLLAYDKKGNIWYGHEEVIVQLNALTSKLGILNFELYKRTLKEYHRNIDVYEMEHNAPKLILFRMVSLAHDCIYSTTDWGTLAINETYTGYLNNYANGLITTYDIQQVIKFIKNRGNSFQNIQISLYPSLPLSWSKHFLELCSKLSGLISIEDLKRSDVDMNTMFIEPSIRNLLFSFYSNWEYNLKNPLTWANDRINELKNQNYGPWKESALGIIAKEINETKPQLSMHRYKSDIIRRKAFSHFLNKLGL